MAVVEWPQTLASLLCRDGERRFLPNQAERGGKGMRDLRGGERIGWGWDGGGAAGG